MVCPDSYSQIRLSVSSQDYKRIWCPDSFAPAIQNCKQISHAAQLLLHLANNTSTTLIHNYLCQECSGYRRGYGRIEVHSVLLKRRESTLAARSEVPEMLEVKDGRWFGTLDDDSPEVKWMRRVYPRDDYTQAPWTVAGTVDRCYAQAAELKHPHLKGSIDVSSAVPHSICLFLGSSPCWRHNIRSGITICNKSYRV